MRAESFLTVAIAIFQAASATAGCSSGEPAGASWDSGAAPSTDSAAGSSSSGASSSSSSGGGSGNVGSDSGPSSSGGLSGGSSGGSGSSGGGSSGSSGSGGVGDGGSVVDGSHPSPAEGGVLLGDSGANLVSLFDGTGLTGWIQVPAASWSVVGGAMHSLGTARGYIYTTNTYGDFRFIFSSRLVMDPANHVQCVLFWGTAAAPVDALHAIQVQPPQGYMWDYRTTGPTANKSPDMFETRFGHPAFVSTQWSQCEMLGNQATGTLRLACCQLTGSTRCKAVEVVDFKDPTAGRTAPLALQVHNAGMIEEFKDLFVESPVADPTHLLTTQ
jgi:hypothetical protein